MTESCHSSSGELPAVYLCRAKHTTWFNSQIEVRYGTDDLRSQETASRPPLQSFAPSSQSVFYMTYLKHLETPTLQVQSQSDRCPSHYSAGDRYLSALIRVVIAARSF
jgi:hypothetical protein